MEQGQIEKSLQIIQNIRQRRTLTQCTVCSMPAIYSYVGAIVCAPCKVFFKRNATNKDKQLKCHYDGNCEISFNTRHVCAACRLAKCFASGMKVELLRNSTTVRKSMSLIQRRENLPTLNLLQNDISTLTTEHWILLSNLINCYEENSTLALAHQYREQQNSLPLKFRYKISTVNELLMSIVMSVQLVFQRNGNFVSLKLNDQMFFLKRTLKHVSGLIACFILRNSKLYDEPGFFQTMNDCYSEETTFYGFHASCFLDPDPTVTKLIFSTMLFSTLDCNYYLNRTMHNIEDFHQIFLIQDKYIEIVWRYLTYKYDFQRAVQCFTRIIRTIFSAINATMRSSQHQNYKEIMENVTEKTKDSLNIVE